MGPSSFNELTCHGDIVSGSFLSKKSKTVSILDFLGKIIHKKTVANLIPVIITPVAVSLASLKDCGVF